MKIAIIGYGLEGRAAYAYWRQGNEITICDRNSDIVLPNDVEHQCGDDYLTNLDRFDLIVRSPHVHPTQIVQANSDAILAKITSNTNEFFRVCPTKQIIGVTGTKGKGTTSSLITAMLQALGHTVHLGGNIGIPALELLQHDISPEDWVVLELSSFQLIDFHYSPHLAVCLMVAAEHLDWHSNIAEYARAKSQLFASQTSDDIAIYFANNELSKQIAAAGAGRKLPYYEAPGVYIEGEYITSNGRVVCATDELRLIGRHNWQNVCAALTAVGQITKDTNTLRDVLKDFKGLEHRLELVKEIDGVRYYDDSFGTTPETAMVALQAFEGPKVIILGGSDKRASFETLAKTIADTSVRQVLLIGQQSQAIQKALDSVGYTKYCAGGTTMSEIVTKAHTYTQSGDVVILSPACASFDMFLDYKDRGQQFKTAVQALS